MIFAKSGRPPANFMLFLNSRHKKYEFVSKKVYISVVCFVRYIF